MSPSGSTEVDESKLTTSGDVPLRADAVMTAVGASLNSAHAVKKRRSDATSAPRYPTLTHRVTRPIAPSSPRLCLRHPLDLVEVGLEAGLQRDSTRERRRLLAEPVLGRHRDGPNRPVGGDVVVVRDDDVVAVEPP